MVRTARLTLSSSTLTVVALISTSLAACGSGTPDAEEARIVSGAYCRYENVPADLRSRIDSDLAVMASITSDGPASPLHQRVFGALEGAAYLKWFQTRVQSIGMDAQPSDSNVVAYVLSTDTARLWVTPTYARFDHPQIARIQVLLHEARHTEAAQGNWPHERCPVPFDDADGQPIRSIWTGAALAGLPACDSVSFGAYGIAAIWLKNLERACTGCTDKVKLDAGIYAADARERITDAGAAGELDRDGAR